jgi:hypothetical protein
MARRTEKELAGVPLSLVYIAGNLVDAEKAERLLTESGIDYLLKLEPFTTASMMRGEYMGLFIYVPTGEHGRCREVLEAGRLTDTVELQASEPSETLHGA